MTTGGAAPPTPAPATAVPPGIVKAGERFVGRAWALRRVADWLATGDERLFLLTGEPGSGKSLLAGWLVGAGPEPDEAEDAAALQQVRAAWSAACFCMARGQAGADITPAWFITCLARQLSARHPVFAQALVRAIAPGQEIRIDVEHNQGYVVGHIGDLNVTLPDARDRYAQGVVEPLRAVAEAHPDQRVAILVDGVDEAFGGPEPTVVSLLARSGSLPANVRFLVTSRYEKAIVDQLLDAFGDAHRLDLSTGDDAARNDQDIRAYIGRRMADDGIDARIEAPSSVATVTDHLARQAAGNFLYIDLLLDELAAGTRPVTDTGELPAGLFDLYRHFLQRIVPGSTERDRGPEWGERYQPLLGSISVALPAAPRDRLAGWLEWEDADIGRFLQTVEQLTEWEPAAGGWRLYHRSLGDFLATRYVDDRGGENRFFVVPPAQHDRIVRYYQRAREERWSGSWANCDDAYCLRNLVRHIQASVPALPPGEQAARSNMVFDVVLDEGFRARQREVEGGLTATYDDVRTAIDAGLSPGDEAEDRLVRLVNTLAVAPAVELRGLAAEGLLKLRQRSQPRAQETMLELLETDSPDAWNVALKAASFAGADGVEVFRRAAVDEREELRRSANLHAYLRWEPTPDCLPVRLLDDLAGRIKISGQLLRKRDRLVFDFLAGLSITIYVNHPDRPQVVKHTSDVWHQVLKQGLKMHLFNKAAFEKVGTPLAAQVYSSRILEAAFGGFQDPGEFFAAGSRADRATIGRMVDLVDPATPLAGHEDDLAALLQSPLPLARMVAGMVLAIHAFADPAATEPVARALFSQVDDTGKRWTIWAFSVLVEKSPPQWVGLLEDLTRAFVEGSPQAFLAADGGTREPFDIDLLPLGLAYGKAGRPMAYLSDLTRQAAAAQDGGALLTRVVRGLAAVGFYHPQGVLGTLSEAVPNLFDPGLEEALVTTLATMRNLHFDDVDLFLRQADAPGDLRRRVSEQGDVELVRRYVAWIGFYNNGVHQALFHPKMRTGLLANNIGALGKANNAKAFIRLVTPGPLRMTREADYVLERWTEP